MVVAPTTREQFFVVTGGPGTGKTTLLTELARRGFATTTEAGRAQGRRRNPGRLHSRTDPVVAGDHRSVWRLTTGNDPHRQR